MLAKRVNTPLVNRSCAFFKNLSGLGHPRSACALLYRRWTRSTWLLLFAALLILQFPILTAGGRGPNAQKETIGVELCRSSRRGGVYICKIDLEGPAAKAGLELHDVIRKVDGRLVGKVEDLESVLSGKQPWDVVILTAQRGRDEVRFEVTVEDPGQATPSSLELAKIHVNKNPSSWRTFNELGLQYLEAKQYGEAIVAFEQALQLHPLNVVAEEEQRRKEETEAQNLAAQKEARRRNQQAKEDQVFGALMGMVVSVPGTNQLTASTGQALSTLGSALSGPGEEPSLLPPELLASSSQPKTNRESSELYENLGKACAGASRWSQAVSSFEQSLSLDPTRTSVLFPMAHACIREAEYDKAVEALRRYLALVPGAGGAPRLMLADLLARLGMPEEARGLLSALVNEQRSKTQADPRNAQLQLEFSLTLLEAGRREEAEKALLTTASLADDLTATDRLSLARALWVAGCLQESSSLTRRILADDDLVDVDRTNALVLLGLILTESGSSTGTAEQHQNALKDWGERHPGLPAPSSLWSSRIELGEAEEAITPLEEEYLDTPMSPESHYNLFILARAYELTERLPAAIVALRESLELTPSFFPALRRLELLEKRCEVLRKASLESAERAQQTGDLSVAVRSLSAALDYTVNPAERRKIQQALMTTVAKMPQQPPLKESPLRYLLLGNAAMKSYKVPADAERAVTLYKWAIASAPAVPSLYLNLSLAGILAKKYRLAEENLRLYLMGNPAEKNSDLLLARLYEMDYQRRQTLKRGAKR